MKYLIVTLAKGELEEFQQRLLYDIPKTFNAKRAIKRRPPAHITLKYFFETEDIVEVEQCVQDFVSTKQSSTYIAKGFNHFDQNVIFIDVFPSIEMKTIHREFLSVLEEKTALTLSGFDRTTHFHLSVAHSDIGEEFDVIWSYVQQFTPEFEGRFDNIAILKVEDELLKLHKTFSFNEK